MKLDTVFVIHHSHTDIGYTADQPILRELQARFIYDALDLADAYRGGPPDSAFRWTVESTYGLEAWLETAGKRDLERLMRAEGEGLVEVTAMLANLTPLVDAVQLAESLRPVRRLRAEYGIDIRFAMNCDVNGHNWTLPDVLLDEGIEGFGMAVNHHFGGPPEPRPDVFLWQAPSGRVLPTLNGWQYSKASDFGIGNETTAAFAGWLPRMQAYLDGIGYPLPFVALQGMHPFGDNGTAWKGYADFARLWNEGGNLPRLVCATPRMFWERVEGRRADLPVRRGDWTDYWNFGAISSARETSVARASRARLYRSDAVFAALGAIAPAGDGGPAQEAKSWARRSGELYRDRAWKELNLYCEHTWGGDEAANDPDTEDSLAMASHKRSMAWNARSLSLLLERDALADFSRRLPRTEEGELLLFNPLPWPRKICGPFPHNLVMRRGSSEDGSASRLFLGRNQRPTDFWTGRSGDSHNGNIGWMLSPTEAPAYGYAIVSPASFDAMSGAEESEDAIVQNHRWRLTFDLERGGLYSLFDKDLGREWIDAGAGLSFHGFVHEEVADREDPSPRRQICEMDWTTLPETVRGWKPDWKAIRSFPTKVLLHKVYRLPYATVIEQILEHPKVGEIRQRVLLPDWSEHIECQSEWVMGTGTHPEATYIALPFDLPGAQARFDAGGVPVRPELDQLPGVNRDYFTVQGWVDFNDGERGVTIAAPENPLVQLGGFHFGHDRRTFELERALFLGWVTNNYWETNFPGRQSGVVTGRYHILPYEGAFDQARSHRFASETAHSRPMLQPLGEPSSGRTLPPSGCLLELPEAPVQTLAIVADAERGGILLTLFNSSEETRAPRVSGGLLRIARAELLEGGEARELALEDGGVSFSLHSYRRATLRLITSVLQ